MEFTAADGLRYHVWRDFERHRVVVTRHGPAGPERIYQGTHNPGARTGKEQYEKLITGLVGLTSRELLAAIFCVTQPLPEMEQVDHSVQELLAGAGGGRPQQALERLAEEAAKWTRYPAEYGFPTNMRKDRELEALQARIRDLAAQIEQARSAVDLYHRSAGHLQAVEAEYEEVRREAAQRRQVLDALQEWQRLAERRRQHRRQVGSLRRALESARDAARQVDELRGRLAREWPELAALPADTGDRLQALIGLEEDLARRAQEAADLERQRRESEQAAEEAEARLRSEFGDVAGRAALPRDVRELRARLAELKRLEARLADLAAEEARLTARLSAGPDWGELGRPAGEAVRRLPHGDGRGPAPVGAVRAAAGEGGAGCSGPGAVRGLRRAAPGGAGPGAPLPRARGRGEAAGGGGGRPGRGPGPPAAAAGCGGRAAPAGLRRGGRPG